MAEDNTVQPTLPFLDQRLISTSQALQSLFEEAKVCAWLKTEESKYQKDQRSDTSDTQHGLCGEC